MSDPAVAEDVLVFRWTPDSFRLIGGRGRGAGWAGIVDVDLNDSPIIARAWRSGVPVRVSSRTKVNVCGPYWAAHAVVVPLGHEHVVVFGGPAVEASPDGVFVTEAARVVAETGDTPAEKLLADELEVVHAVRALMNYQAVNVRDTARHVATVAAKALSCDVAAVRVRGPHKTTIDVVQMGGADLDDRGQFKAGRDAEPFLDAASSAGTPIVEQTAGKDPEVWTERVVSRMTLPIGAQVGFGALSLGHSEGHERGFTSLCQRIGRALAESAEPLLNQAIIHEQLATEREHYQRATLTDSLTGLGNHAAWEWAKTSPPPLAPSSPRRVLPQTYALLSADVDDLKSINDRHGHAAGDAALKAAADALRFSLRPTDVLCRVGGDEFVAVLPNVDERRAQRIVRRIDELLSTSRPTEHGPAPRVSIGWAVYDGDWDATMRLADQRMYRRKRRGAAGRPGAKPSKGSTRPAWSLAVEDGEVDPGQAGRIGQDVDLRYALVAKVNPSTAYGRSPAKTTIPGRAVDERASAHQVPADGTATPERRLSAPVTRSKTPPAGDASPSRSGRSRRARPRSGRVLPQARRSCRRVPRPETRQRPAAAWERPRPTGRESRGLVGARGWQAAG